MGTEIDDWNTPYDGVDRCRWLNCYRPANGGGRLFCAVHERAPGNALLREALHAAAELNGED